MGAGDSGVCEYRFQFSVSLNTSSLLGSLPGDTLHSNPQSDEALRMRDLLILGTRADPHNRWIEGGVRALGAQRVFVIDFQESLFEVHVDERGIWSLTVDGSKLNDNFVVWDRSIIQAGTPFYPRGGDLDEASTRAFVAEEWRTVYRLLCGLSCEVLNSLDSRKCMAKPWQQIVAAKVGFRVPETMVTNIRGSLAAFYANLGGAMVIKSMSSTKIRLDPKSDQEHFNVMTMRASEADVATATEEDVRYCPHLLQHEIRKTKELRVVWVDGEAIAFQVDSQRFKASEVDWRNASDVLEFSRYELPADINTKINCFMDHVGLFSGSLDLIIDEDGKCWFLECNQQGAWGWLDEVAEGDLRRLFAAKIYNRLQ
jgi:hypothetical protein